MDYLNFANDVAIKKLMESNDKVLFSNKVFKYNASQWRQERVLLITNKYLYNLKKKSEKRKIPLTKIDCLTKSTDKESNEFVIHITSEYDYRYESGKRDEIIEVLKQEHLKHYKKNLLIYGVPDKNLTKYVSTQDDRKKGIYRIPEEQFRLADEDLIVESSEADTMNDVEAPNLNGGVMLYSRNPEDEKIALNSFTIVKELKKFDNETEYLVEKKETKEIYTLRVIRKITLLNTDEITAEFAGQEAKKNLSHPFLLQPEFIFKGDGALYVLFKLIFGKNLAQLLKEEKRMNERKACFFSFQICLALTYLHARGVIYRCLRPENVLLDENGYVYLNDFGVYRFMTHENQKTHIASMILKYPIRQEY